METYIHIALQGLVAACFAELAKLWRNYFQTLKIYFHDVKIVIHDMINIFHVVKLFYNVGI